MKIFAKNISWVFTPIRNNLTFFVFMFLLGCICILSDPETYKTTTFFQLLFDDYVICILLSLIPGRARTWIKGVLYVILYAFAFIDVYCIVRLGSGINPTLVQTALATNSSEASEAFKTYISLDYFLSPILLVLFCLLLHVFFSYKDRNVEKSFAKRSSLLSSRTKKNISLGFIALLIACAVIDFTPKRFFAVILKGNVDNYMILNCRKDVYHAGEIYYIPIYKFIYSLKVNSYGFEDVNNIKKTISKIDIKKCNYKSPNIILIIGESHSKHHSELYDYSLPVTPFQMERYKNGDLFPFSNVISPFSYTLDSFKNLFSISSIGDKGKWTDYPLFPAIFRKAGYHTTFITNQFTQDSKNFVDQYVGMFFNNREVSDSLFDVRNKHKHEFDGDLISDYDSLQVFNTKNNLIIFHLIGLHAEYKERYPDSFKRFSIDDYINRKLTKEQKQILADYDNAALYNDFVLEQIIKKFEKEDAIIVYVPDHGEECFDGNTDHGRPVRYNPVDVYQMFQIPFWIYMSKTYQEKNPDIVESIKKSTNKPFMTDQIGQMLLFLGGIETKWFKNKDNILDENFNEKRKRIIKNDTNYDELIKKLKL